MITLADAIRTARSRAIADALNTGAEITLYSGTRPASGAAVTAQTALVVMPLPEPAATVEAGVLVFEAIAEAMAQESGTATWARTTDSVGGYVMDLDVSATEGGGDIELSSTNIIKGGLVRITAGTIREP